MHRALTPVGYMLRRVAKMPIRTDFAAPAVCLALSALSGVSVAQTQLPAGKDWPLVGGDWGNTRYSTLVQIDVHNVQSLNGAWTSKPFENGAASRSTPVVHDGLMIITAGLRVYALNPKSGAIVWTYETDFGQGAKAAEASRNVVAVLQSGRALPGYQGVAVGEGMVFAGLTDGQVTAIDEKTGQKRWSRQIGDDPPKRGQSVSGAPTYANGVVFCGLANGDFGIRGRVVALDAKTGRELWHFYTVPGPGELGHDSWAQDNEVWKFGGAGVWQTGVLDPKLGMAYFAVGNPVPQNGGELRAGNNLFTDSVIALDMKTGRLRWHYQVVHHDIWDVDIATPLVLYDDHTGKRSRKALAAMRPDGYLFFLDRETGETLTPVEERAVPQDAYQRTAATQPYPVGVEPLVPDCASWGNDFPSGFVLGCSFIPDSRPPPSGNAPNILAPTFSVRVRPLSYSSQTQYFYAQSAATLEWRRRADDPYFLPFGSHVPGLKNRFVLAAIDSRSGKIAWKKDVSPAIYGRSGLLSTAGGLLFRGSGDGNFQAYDAKTGEQLWQFQTGQPGGGGPPSSYQIDGEQYVAFAAGASVWAFKLHGQVAPVAVPRSPAMADGDFAGPIEDTDQIETLSLEHDAGANGNRYLNDEYAFNPYRARVKVGTRVTWLNNGRVVHTIVAQDGSWTTGALQPAQTGYVTFDKPGVYSYICKEHPWSYGQLIVVPEVAQVSSSDGGSTSSSRGQSLYRKSCSSCHRDDLSGSDRAPALIGNVFWTRWKGRSESELLNRIRTTMPQDRPGSLTTEAYADIVGYILNAGGISADRGILK